MQWNSQPYFGPTQPSSSGRPILSLDPNLDNSSAVDAFDLDYFDDDCINPSGNVASEFDQNEIMDSSFDPSKGFQEAFRAPPSEAGVL